MAEPFDIHKPLAPGTSVLEASAGTGKTWTLAAITAKLVAEGTALERLLLVTFTRAATSELRERIRTRLVSVGRGLETKASGYAPAEDDVVVELLAECDRTELAARRRRISRALADFDAATITTIHGFCQEVLGGLGVLGDLDPGYEFSDDLSELRGQISDDLYVWRFRDEEQPKLTLGEAREVAEVAMSKPEVPLAAAAGDLPRMRRRLAVKARELFDARKRRLRLLGYDDLLTRLVAAMRGEHADEVAARVGSRWDVVLVDEFQDTDPLQWEIVREAFAERDATVVLVGDPKQAIYAFRGADVFAYLQAAEAASARPTLDTNYRSDQPLIDAYDALFGNSQLGHPGIIYRPVQAPPQHRGSGLRGAPVDVPLRFRILQRDQRRFRISKFGELLSDEVNPAVIADVAADIVELLSSDARVRESASDGLMAEAEVMPRHIAVLVRANWQASAIRDALADAGVPAVINGAGSVFDTEIAQQWRRLLVALDRPSSRANARTAALTSFFGWTPEQLASGGDEQLEPIHRRLHRYARVLRERGVAAMVEEMSAFEEIPARMLALADGERRLTDLRHIAQLLHAEAVNEGRGLSALTAWLYREVNEAGGDIADERSRRLDSDEEAVQVLTIHRSKGLEFPIVYAPFLWSSQKQKDGKPVTFHDESGARTLDVGLVGSDYKAHREAALIEDRGEELRLAYVALTRARHQAVVWWAPGYISGNSPLARLLLAREADGTIGADSRATPDDEVVLARIEELERESGGVISAEVVPLPEPLEWHGPTPAPAALEAAEFDRGLDSLWRRNSYSSITAAAHEAAVASEPEGAGLVDDEPAGDEELGAADEGPAAGPEGEAPPSLWAELPGGRRFGTLIHSVFERIDFAAEDLEAELAAAVAGQLAYHRMEIDAAALVAALAATIETPLGPVADGRSLRTVAASDRLDELFFELPLVGGDEPSGTMPVSAIGELLCERLAADDPLARYARGLSAAELGRTVRGYLTGSIDLALRLGGDGDGWPRFLIVDYKTNWIGAAGEELTSWSYRPEAVAAAMERGHYWLQALLYLVALHRYLRWRLPDYDPDVNLGGVLYLFVRGMAGAATPVYGDGGATASVAAWRPPTGVIAELSALLDRGSRG